MTKLKQSEPDYDAILIGSGLGGLIAGALLSKRGKKILLLEQHNVPGGCATTFKRKGYNIEVGLNAMGGLDQDDVKQNFFTELEIPKHVKMLLLPEFYAYRDNKFKFVMPNSYPENMQALLKQFPAEQQNIKKYFKRILRIRKQMNVFCSWSFRKQRILLFVLPFVLPAIVFNMFRTVGGFLKQTFNNENLKKILLANLAYFHDNPHTLSLLYFAAGQGEYYKGGGYYIQEGSQKLSNYLASLINNNGGTIKYRSEVVGINTSGNKVTGVEYLEKKGMESRYHDIPTNLVVCNTAIPHVINAFLDKKFYYKLNRKYRKQTLSPSFFVVFLVFKQPLKNIGNKHYSTFIPEKKTARKSSSLNRLDYFENTSFYFCDYSQLDARLSDSNIGQGVICCNDRMERWEYLSRGNYMREKDIAANILIDRLNDIVPEMKNEIKHYEVGTPKTIQRYIRTPGGAVYGFAQTPRQAVPFRQSVKSGIHGLYFASAWAFPGGGFSGSMMSGYSCANAISPLN